MGEMVQNSERPIVVDMEAGLEHFSRGTARYSDTVLIIIEPYFKSMETGARMNELAGEIALRRVFAVANKVRSPDDDRILQQFCRQRGLDLIAMIPEDDAIRQADRLGVAPLDYDPSAIALKHIEVLTQKLLQAGMTQ